MITPEGWLQAIVNQSNDGILSKNLDGTIVSWNAGAENLFGYKASEMIGSPILRLFPADRMGEEAAILERIARGDHITHFETVRMRKDGQPIDVSVSISPIFDDGGKIVGASKIIRDISEQKKMTRSLQRSEEELSVTLNSIGDAVLVTDTKTRVVRMNPVAAELMGISSAEAIGRPVGDVFRIFNDQTRLAAEIAVNKVLATGAIHGLANGTILVRPDGTELSIADSAAPIRKQDGTVTGVVFVFRDITNERKREMELRYFAAIVESSNDAIISKTLRGTVTSWNNAAERLFGFSANEMIGSPILKLFPQGRVEEEEMILAEVMGGRRVNHFETVRLAKDGRNLDVSVTISPIRDEHGVIVGASKIVRDISERKKAERDLARHAEQLEEAVAVRTRELAVANRQLSALDQSKSDFLQMISHEFRTPLNGLLGVSEIILSEMPDDQQPEFRQIHAEARERMLAILEDALLIAEIDNATDFGQSVVSLTAVLDQAMQEAARHFVSREWKFAAEGVALGAVVGHELLLVHALRRLIETAVKLCGDGEEIRIIRERRNEFLTVRIESPGRCIPASAAERLFGIFSLGQVITSGDDLGLAPAVAGRILALFGASASVETVAQPPMTRLVVSFPPIVPVSNSGSTQ